MSLKVNNLIGFGSKRSGATAPPLSNLFAWYNSVEAYDNVDPASGSIITSDSTAINSLKDLSGNNFHLSQSTSGKRPTYESNEINTSLPIIRFNGSTHILGVTGLSGTISGMSVFMVIKQVAWNDNDCILSVDGSINSGKLQQRSSTPNIRFSLGSEVDYLDNNAATLSTHCIVGATFNGSSSQFYINSTSSSGTLTTPTTNYSAFYLGNSVSESFGSQIDFAELLIYNSGLSMTSGNGLLTRQYLSSKYGISI